jgi:hypothetical protein
MPHPILGWVNLIELAIELNNLCISITCSFRLSTFMEKIKVYLQGCCNTSQDELELSHELEEGAVDVKLFSRTIAMDQC